MQQQGNITNWCEIVVETVDCPYCHGQAELVDSEVIYGRSYGMAYLCRPCKAWVGCHAGTVKPLGRLANAELRAAKMAAHSAFDPLWQAKVKQGWSKKKARGAGYNWLIEQLGIPREECHIGMMDAETCRKVVDVCSRALI